MLLYNLEYLYKVAQIRDDRNTIMQAIVGKKYRHYKNGREYTVIALGRHSETHEELVVYRAEYNSTKYGDCAVWVRPCTIFEDLVTHEGNTVPRFTPL